MWAASETGHPGALRAAADADVRERFALFDGVTAAGISVLAGNAVERERDVVVLRARVRRVFGTRTYLAAWGSRSIDAMQRPIENVSFAVPPSVDPSVKVIAAELAGAVVPACSGTR